MKNAITFLIAFLCIAAPVTCLAASDHAADERAIRAVWRGFEADFNKGDAKACASVYTTDGDRLDSFGVFFQGRDNIERSYVDLFGGPYKGGVESSQIVKIRFLTDDVAVVDLDSQVRGLAGMTSPRVLQATTVYVKQDGQWKIAAHRPHVKPAPAPAH